MLTARAYPTQLGARSETLDLEGVDQGLTNVAEDGHCHVRVEPRWVEMTNAGYPARVQVPRCGTYHPRR
jgi:hypothetical protein